MSSWSTEFEVGLVDDFDFTVERSYFATDQKYNNGNTILLQWEGRTDNVDLPETHVWFTAGKGWISNDGGKTIVHESGKPFGNGDGKKYFNGSSAIAKLISRCVIDFGLGETLEARGLPNVAAVWEGLTFHMKYETVDYGKGSGIEAKSKLLPVRFVGVAGSPVANGDKVAAARAKAAATNGNGARSAVTALAKSVDDYAEFQAKAVEVPGVLEDDDLLASVLSETGIYAEARS